MSKTATDSCFPSLPWSSSAEIVETAQGLRPPPDLFTRREQGASADHRRPQASWHQRPKQLGSLPPPTRCTATGNATVVSDHCRLEKPMLHLAGAFKLLNNVSCWGSSSSSSWTMLVAGDHHHHHHQHHHHHHHHQEGETIPNVSKPVAISSTYFKDSSQPDVRTQAAPAAL